VYVGRDRTSATRDPVLGRYGVERACSTLALPIARALASLAPEASLTPAHLAPLARALVRAAASAAPPQIDALLDPLSCAAVATLVEHLFALSVPPPAPSRAAGQLRELHAIASVL
jgi:hypothetical protein